MSERGSLNLSFAVVILPLHEWGIQNELECRFEEAKQFVIINRTQKTVRVDLADQFIKRLPPERREEIEGILLGPRRLKLEILANKITEKMAASSSVWRNKIRYPNEGRSSGKPVSWKSFKDSIILILRSEWGQNVIATFNNEDDIVDEVCKVLDEFWKAWMERCRRAFEDPCEYVIQRTTGVFVLHRLFPVMADYLLRLGMDYSARSFLRLIDYMDKGVSSTFWHRKGDAGKIGTSQKAFKELADMLKESLRDGIYRMAFSRLGNYLGNL